MAAAKKRAVKPARKRAKPQQKFVRNLRNLHVSLYAQDRRIELAPRGQRRDYAPLNKGDQADEKFMGDKGVLFEIITKTEADSITEKQTTNMQEKRHPALDTLRNPEGDSYPDDAVQVERQHDQQGKKVADLDSEEERGNRFNWGVGIRRAELPGTTDRPLPDMPDSVAPEDQGAYRLNKAAEADAVARNKAAEGPAAGLPPNAKVTKDPTQRT